jgi:pimeloyl-ACP methyl ester carboxylesterase
MQTLYERSIHDPEWLSIFDHPDLAPKKTLDVDGYATGYFEAGSPTNPPLVLIHGGNFQIGSGADRWYPNILPLAKNFHVYAVDELGGGDTDPPRNLAEIGDVQVRGEHILRFVDKLGLGPVHLCGQSQGAWIAAYIAIKRPDLVSKLVLVDTASMALPAGGVGGANIAVNFSDSFYPGTMVKRDIQATADSIRNYFSTVVHDQSMISDPWVEHVIPLARKWLPIWDKPWREFWADGGKRNRDQYVVDGRHLGEYAPQLVRPLIIWGNNSAKGVDNGLAFYKRIPDAQFHVFDKSNHFLWLDQWKEFNSLVGWFLSRPQ